MQWLPVMIIVFCLLQDEEEDEFEGEEGVDWVWWTAAGVQAPATTADITHNTAGVQAPVEGTSTEPSSTANGTPSTPTRSASVNEEFIDAPAGDSRGFKRGGPLSDDDSASEREIVQVSVEPTTSRRSAAGTETQSKHSRNDLEQLAAASSIDAGSMGQQQPPAAKRPPRPKRRNAYSNSKNFLKK